jgi:uncharacterized protein YcfL
MKKKVVSVFLVSTLLFGCGSTKNTADREPKKEVVSEQHDPIMKLLVSGLIIYSINILFTR